MVTNRFLHGFLGFILLSAPVAARAEYCFNERITSVITQDGAVWFTTDKSCPNWCGLKSALSTDERSRQYSLLLTALTTERLVSFYWSQSASGSNCPVIPTLGAPDLMALK